MSAATISPARGWPVVAARLNALNLRERAMAFIIVLALVYAAWHSLLFAPLDARRASLLSQVPSLEAGIASLNTHAARLAVERGADPDAEPREQLQTLRLEGARLDTLLVELTERLVPPRRMAAMLDSVLTRETDLRLVRLAGLGAERLRVPATTGAEADTTESASGTRGGARAAAARPPAVEADAVSPSTDEVAAPGLYRHGLRVEFEGGYLQTIAYLRALESLQSRFLWEALEFDVLQYPGARVAITVYSLSLDDAWIGI